MREFFDVALIGGGPAAVFAAYEFSLKYPELKVVILEEGHPIEQRKCPLAQKKVDHCLALRALRYYARVRRRRCVFGLQI